jgi:hypothetical protein
MHSTAELLLLLPKSRAKKGGCVKGKITRPPFFRLPIYYLKTTSREKMLARKNVVVSPFKLMIWTDWTVRQCLLTRHKKTKHKKKKTTTTYVL